MNGQELTQDQMLERLGVQRMTDAARTLIVLIDQLEDCSAEVGLAKTYGHDHAKPFVVDRHVARQRLTDWLKRMTLADLASLP